MAKYEYVKFQQLTYMNIDALTFKQNLNLFVHLLISEVLVL